MQSHPVLVVLLSFLVAVIGIIVICCQFEGSPAAVSYNLGLEEDAERNTSQLIISRGYSLEEHTVETEDGFVLSLQRIPHGRDAKQTPSRRREAVLLVHGLQSASDCFMLNEHWNSLGYVLADAGYDVWLANNRGNRYSKKHRKYTTSDTEFWNFSFDEMAKYDLPAFIKYILGTTSQDQLFYIGMSQGSTSVLALLSDNPEFNKKIKLNIGMPTAGYMTHVEGIPRFMFATVAVQITNFFGPFEYQGSIGSQLFARVVCGTRLRIVCLELAFMFGRCHHINETRSGVFFTHYPSGTSSRAFAHFGQMITAKKFQKYDFGKEKNLLRYEQESPPEYDMSRVTAPTALMWSASDLLSTPRDIDTLRQKLPNVVFDHEVRRPGFSHFDFVVATDAPELVIKEVLRMLRDFDDEPDTEKRKR